jgi:hypothetical protein
VLESIGALRKIFARIDKTMVKNLTFQKQVLQTEGGVCTCIWVHINKYL